MVKTSGRISNSNDTTDRFHQQQTARIAHTELDILVNNLKANSPGAIKDINNMFKKKAFDFS